MYTVVFTTEAEADLSRFDKPIVQRILKKIRWLAENFNLIIPEALVGQWQGLYKLRVGNYRVLYCFDKNKQQIIVHLVGHRRNIYNI